MRHHRICWISSSTKLVGLGSSFAHISAGADKLSEMKMQPSAPRRQRSASNHQTKAIPKACNARRLVLFLRPEGTCHVAATRTKYSINWRSLQPLLVDRLLAVLPAPIAHNHLHPPAQQAQPLRSRTAETTRMTWKRRNPSITYAISSPFPACHTTHPVTYPRHLPAAIRTGSHSDANGPLQGSVCASEICPVSPLPTRHLESHVHAILPSRPSTPPSQSPCDQKCGSEISRVIY